ncbi:membrane integrity-associated transporter subunit PqiC [Aquincola sp. S2]|uniref:Membrane integrity-associated transporter subunit PqiC n=1 Tax=Pseudaquabacterium terrae TaxID=2732868 RepID=A0ABX2EB91_9BURK|nr:ABC-type transport auxiliary lipoprotein family protein [Aquabacterium terrae]NRF65669.1 membrane integrity-associated transporter subunit PqiC [Aquabacterium terrae]
MTTRRHFTAALLPLLPACLPSCVSVDIGQDAPAHTYLGLHDDGRGERRAQPLVPALLVQALPADALAETASIAYSRQPHQYAFYQLASWTERPVRLVPRLLQRRLEARGVAQAVGVLGDPLRADWLLTLSLDALYHDVSDSPGRARLAIGAELVDRRQRKRVARRSFDAAVVVARADSTAAAQGLSAALTQVFDALLPWLETSLQQAATSS